MSRAEKWVIAVTALVVLMILWLDAIAPREPNWSETYTRYQRDPYACALTYERLEDLFHHGITTVHDPIYLTAQQRLEEDNAPRVNHIFIDRDFKVDDLDLENLLEMVRRGDNALIAASDLSHKLLDTLHLETGYHWGMPDSAEIAQGGLTAFLHGDTAALHFTCAPLNKEKEALFTRGGSDTYFSSIRIDSTQVLAENERRDAVLVRVRFGKGWIYLCSVPKVFSNYYLLRNDTRDFMANALSFLPDAPVLWDEFYKKGRLEQSTPLRFILSRPSLKRAYWTVLALITLYIFVFAKRRQRAIPIVQPLRNTSREFADTIGRLYYFTGDHADLARKMGAHFKEDLRQRLYLRRAVWDAETIAQMAKRTGISEEEWQRAFRLIEHYETAPNVSEEQLLQLNKTLSGLRGRI